LSLSWLAPPTLRPWHDWMRPLRAHFWSLWSPLLSICASWSSKGDQLSFVLKDVAEDQIEEFRLSNFSIPYKNCSLANNAQAWLLSSFLRDF
jgi:hypothetical protein